MLRIISILTLAFLSGCSVYMAAAGENEPNLGAFGVGSSRGQVQQQLGSPKSSSTVDNNRIDTYEYTLGNEPSAGRAIAHGVGDVLTFGLWELFGTPIEAATQGDLKTMTITYNANGKVSEIN